MASENEKLKKEVLTFESEREKMNQQSLLLSSNLLQSKQDYKKFLNLKFISGKKVLSFKFLNLV